MSKIINNDLEYKDFNKENIKELNKYLDNLTKLAVKVATDNEVTVIEHETTHFKTVKFVIMKSE